MALSQPAPPGRQPSPLLSNNPFRNRAASPTSASPSSPAGGSLIDLGPSSNPTNPFLDASEPSSSKMEAANGKKDGSTTQTTELFEDLSIDEKRPPPPYSARNGVNGKNENVPPRANGRPPQLRHHPTRSAGEDERRRMGHPRPRGPPGERNIFDDPPDRLRERRPRRNSDSSTMDRPSKLLDPEDERRRQERRRREGRHREHRSHKSKQPSKRMDIIDKLDVTSIYGTGLFHHDGPFDACNPHRNKKNSRNAPMQAFPKDSRNMMLGGSGPNRSNLDLNQIHGVTEQGFNDFSNTAGEDYVAVNNAARPWNPERSQSYGFNAHTKSDPVHGDESMGLGTSTFLEGAPASRAALERHQNEQETAMQQQNAGAGLGRKKSLAQRIRGINNRPGPGRSGMTSPDSAGLERTMSPTSPGSGTPSSAKNERNPFFKDYDQEYERKGAQIRFEEDKLEDRVRSPSSPPRPGGLERTGTNGSIGGGEEAKTGGGFLNRVKSLRGPKKPRPERRDTSS
ncbi:MAG: hypothetical protein Q9227_003707 [Pyrenula ochraceoflavens]